MNERELMEILQVPSFKRVHQATNKYTAGAKSICKAFNDASVSAKEFNAALIEVSELMQ